MTKEYYQHILQEASEAEKKLLLSLMRSAAFQEAKVSVDKNALMIDFPNWKVVFYSQDDIKYFLGLLEENLACFA